MGALRLVVQREVSTASFGLVLCDQPKKWCIKGLFLGRASPFEAAVRMSLCLEAICLIVSKPFFRRVFPENRPLYNGR